MTPRARIAIAVGLTLGGLGVPIAYAWISGERAAEAEHLAILAAPVEEARAAAGRVAARVRDELAGLAERESARPYYEWQSLIVDPRGAYEGEAVVPSPLAAGPTEPLVAGHYQIDAAGRVTSPEVNEAPTAPAPEARAVARLAALREALKDPGTPAPAEQPEPAEQVEQVEQAKPPEPSPQALQQEVQVANAGPVVEQRLSNEVYQQNVSAPAVWEALQQRKNPTKRAFAPGVVTVKLGPFAWRALELQGAPVLAAERPVETPDGPRRQGFVVDGARLAALLHDGGLTASLVAPETTEAGAISVPLDLPGLQRVVRVALPDRQALMAAAEVPRAEQRLRAILLLAFGVLAAAAILWLVLQAERLLERRQRFAAAAAHELRTPLAGLRMYAEMLAHGLGRPEKQQAYAERLASEAARLGRVVSNVLDFTRLERRSLAVDPKAQDVAALVEEIARRHEPGLVEAGACLVLARPAGPVMARCDGDALAQILGNLLDNAEKYTREAVDRTITVTVEARAEAIAIRVRDRGPGLPDARRMFKAFARGARAGDPAGLGLGLSLARALARAQGGDLVAGDPGVGAELIATVPAASHPPPTAA